MRLISIDGSLFKIKDADWKELNESSLNNKEKEYHKKLDTIKENYRYLGEIDIFNY